MKAVQISDYGDRENLELREIEVPTPRVGEALVQLDYAGINFIDVYMRQGDYRNSSTYGTPLPFTLGMEGAGTIVDANGVQGISVGDHVAYCLSRGSYAEYAVVPAWKLVEIPTSMDPAVATVLMLQGCTAHYLSHSLFPIRAEQWCLVHAGAGGVGQLLIQLAKARGAKVITTVGSAGKAEIVKELGADHVVLYLEDDFYQVVQELTGGQGVHVVYDAVGADTIDRSIRSLRTRGTCVNYGGSSGLVENVRPLDLADAGSTFFTRPHLAHYMVTQAEIKRRAEDLFRWVAEGALKVRIDSIFPLAEATAAHERIEQRKTTGKLLLRTTDS